ncbi:MAG: hypothetical protein L7S70_07045, partial [Pseudomonadales bacterium]|nr:hypothetical protein [Pseudomonadales bacterium]
MNSPPRPDLKVFITFIAFLWSSGLHSQVPTPESVFGFEPGADYKLASYQQLLDFYRQLDAASPRVELEEIGTTVLG